MKNRIYITNDQNDIKVTPSLRGLIIRAVNHALKEEDFGRNAEVSVTLTNDEKIHEINRQYRSTDKSTDVLSFPMFDEDFDDGEDAVLGDIVISLEHAKAQSELYGHTFDREVAFLTVHSVLHLLGYDHMTEDDDKNMRAHQDIVMQSLGLAINSCNEPNK